MSIVNRRHSLILKEIIGKKYSKGEGYGCGSDRAEQCQGEEFEDF